MEIDLRGKTALVTGGARGIGEAVSRAFASAGARIIVNYNRSGERAARLRDELRASGTQCEIIQADVSEPGQVESLFERVRQGPGTLDILVNNAGIIRDTLLLTMELFDWEKVHDVNLRAAFLTSKMAAELMITRRSGKIINIASIAALSCSRGQANYAASKGGLISFTRACAVELAPKGILVNAILPGVIETRMSVRARKLGGQALLGRIPLNRCGRSEEVANMVVFLASDKADYITGQSIVIDGGLSIS